MFIVPNLVHLQVNKGYKRRSSLLIHYTSSLSQVKLLLLLTKTILPQLGHFSRKPSTRVFISNCIFWAALHLFQGSHLSPHGCLTSLFGRQIFGLIVHLGRPR